MNMSEEVGCVWISLAVRLAISAAPYPVQYIHVYTYMCVLIYTYV